MIDKQTIGKEIRTWIDRDPKYTSMLIPYALSLGIITQEEARASSEDLKNYYNDTAQKNSKLDEAVMALIPELGFTKCKILYNMVEMLPKYYTGSGFDFFAHDDQIRKKFEKMSSQAYYLLVKELTDSGYISWRTYKRKKIYTINFQKFTETQKVAGK